MSIALLSAAWNLTIGSTEKMVLMCLCDYANDDGGNCWPSVATLGRKCSKSTRTIQTALRWLEANGFLTTDDLPGKAHRFTLDPRKICTPAKSAPPQKMSQTPAKSAPNPLREPPVKNTQKRAREIPDDWQPKEFGITTKSRAVVDGWPPGEAERQAEHFAAHHRAKGNEFKDWQEAWSTWVLNKRDFGNGRSNQNIRAIGGIGDDKRSGLAHAIDDGIDHIDRELAAIRGRA